MLSTGVAYVYLSPFCTKERVKLNEVMLSKRANVYLSPYCTKERVKLNEVTPLSNAIPAKLVELDF